MCQCHCLWPIYAHLLQRKRIIFWDGVKGVLALSGIGFGQPLCLLEAELDSGAPQLAGQQAPATRLQLQLQEAQAALQAAKEESSALKSALAKAQTKISKAQSSAMRTESDEVHIISGSHQAVQTDKRSIEPAPFAAAQSQATSSGQVRGDDTFIKMEQTTMAATAAVQGDVYTQSV
ncbi:TPA: hypothetical protein ACH3X1_002741 [Trebouxia sp. C0004]